MDECRVVREQKGFEGVQGLSYFQGVSRESTGSQGICMHLVEFPPGARAKAHYHEAHETAIFMLEGTVGMHYGDDLGQHLEATAGDFVYIPAGVPHLPYNASDSHARAVLARTDPNEQESVVLCPE
ncbi:MAG: cupin domain-containing protein [Armatimonadetes bacterium]|nr:cupin domain-containing protein [Armatimonadota bacterium]